MILCNIEFYSTPDGEVMVKECNQAVRKLEESDRDLILSFFIAIRDRYPVAMINKIMILIGMDLFSLKKCVALFEVNVKMRELFVNLC